MSKTMRASVCIIVGQQGGEPRILAIPAKPASDRKLGLPGGKAEGAESPRATAVRETFEEVGLWIPEEDLMVVDQRWFGFREVTYTLVPYSASYGVPNQSAAWYTRAAYLAQSAFPLDDTSVLKRINLYTYAYQAAPIATAA